MFRSLLDHHQVLKSYDLKRIHVKLKKFLKSIHIRLKHNSNTRWDPNRFTGLVKLYINVQSCGARYKLKIE